MNNIVELKTKEKQVPEPQIWTCICGGQTFLLYSDGVVQCDQCDLESGDMICGMRDEAP